MHCLVFIIIGLLIFEGANTLFLVESPQQNKTQPLGFLIRKPPGKIERRSNFGTYKSGYSNENSKENSLDNVVVAIDTGVKQFMAGKTEPDVIDNIAKSLVKLAKKNADPIYRAKGQEYDIKPQTIHFRNDKPSVMFEISSKSIINLINDLLQSKTVHKYMAQFSKEAALIYRTVKQELEKVQKSEKANKQ